MGITTPMNESEGHKIEQELQQAEERPEVILPEMPETTLQITEPEFLESEPGTQDLDADSPLSELSTPTSLTSATNSLKSDLKAQVEAVLFVSDTPLKAGAIAKMLNTAYDDVQSALVQLIQEYEDRSSGLEIGTDDGYIIQVKTQYLNIVTDMMPLELNPGPMRTLSAIALKEPVLQSEVIDMRGSGAYEHINELAEMDLITKKPQGLSYILKTTKKFEQYFRLTQDANKVKQRLQEETTKRIKEKAQNAETQELQTTEQAPTI